MKGKPRQPTGGKAGGASGRTDSDAYINEAIAKKMIDFAKAGERNPDLLCERVLNIIRMHCRAWRQLLRISKSEAGRLRVAIDAFKDRVGVFL